MGAFLNSLRARIIVEIRLGVARTDFVNFNPGRLQFDCRIDTIRLFDRLDKSSV